ncbi:leucine-rich repeat domain-containing protein [Spirosoma spitsbergense]|uniref:leucine-rich repeat domain-containing protein n=1 Tax=Spirosoma spitsbergense TaxID=431554 RepID=UPI0003621C73|nr:leucine-rich repeat domain-containing protein [Spirosoma spitsbergense]
MSDLARQLIAENQRTHAPFLDLGNCGLKDSNLPTELFTLTWLTALNLGDCYKNSQDNWKASQNTGVKNQLSEKSLHQVNQLEQIQRLDLSSNRVNDIRFLAELPQLQSLDLRNNQITAVSNLGVFK